MLFVYGGQMQNNGDLAISAVVNVKLHIMACRRFPFNLAVLWLHMMPPKPRYR